MFQFQLFGTRDPKDGARRQKAGTSTPTLFASVGPGCEGARRITTRSPEHPIVATASSDTALTQRGVKRPRRDEIRGGGECTVTNTLRETH